MMPRAAICLLLLRFAGCAPAPAMAQYVPPRAPRVARSLRGDQIARVVTNAPATARIGVPMHGLRAWSAGIRVAPGDAVSREGSIYVCVQMHTTQADWTPAATPALWCLVRAPGDGAIPAWRQPMGAHDAYALGARVTHGGHVWCSTINANVWAPGIYGWVRE
jgi:hypothetical protein